MEKKYFTIIINGLEIEANDGVSSYEQQAIDFLKDTDTTMKIMRVDKRTDGVYINSGLHHDYKVTLKRNNKTWSFFFSDSVWNRKKNMLPSAYDILACLQKYEVEIDFSDFCNEFGYDEYITNEYGRIVANTQAEKIHKAVLKEYEKVMLLFEDVIDKLELIN